MFVMKNPQIPFIYGRVVDSPHFINREDELKRLTTNLNSGLNTILISPRRWGKSSLVAKAIAKLSHERTVTVCKLDLFNIRKEKEFYEALTREVLRNTSNRMEEWVSNGKKFLTRLIPQFTFGVDPYQDFSVSFNLSSIAKDKEDIL